MRSSLPRRGDNDDDASSSASTNPSALFDLPAALAAFTDKLGTAGSLSCDAGGGTAVDTRSGGYKTNGSGKDGTRYCADGEGDEPTYVWWQSNMDIDCDGSDGKGEICNGDGASLPSGLSLPPLAAPTLTRGSPAGSYQSSTTFQDGASSSTSAPLGEN